MGLIGRLLKAGKSVAKGAKVKSAKNVSKYTTTAKRDQAAADFVKKIDADRYKVTPYEKYYEPNLAKTKETASAEIAELKRKSAAAAERTKREAASKIKKAKKSSFVKGTVVGGGAVLAAKALTEKKTTKKKPKKTPKPKGKYKF